MAGMADLFGPGSTARQLLVWGVAQQVIVSLMSPALTELSQVMNELAPNLALSPTQAANMAGRGLITQAHGEAEAAKGGVNAERFDQMVTAERTVPPLDAVLQLWRRGKLPQVAGSPDAPGVDVALANMGLRPEWRDAVLDLAITPPSPGDALNALLEGQLPHDEALAWFAKGGGDPEAFQWLYDTNGQAPTPVEALELLNRGIIPERGTGPASVSYEQAFLEGPWRNKWLAPFLALRDYLPPPRTVTAMLRAGSITEALALTLLEKQGLTAELAAAYVADATHSATHADKDLAKADVLTLYQGHSISDATATGLLVALGYSAASAGLLLSIAGLRRAIADLNSAVSRVKSLYVAHKIGKGAAVATLNALALPATEVTALVDTWTTERNVNVRTLTEAQVVAAWDNKILTTDQAMTELTGMGYVPFDAWVLLSNKNGAALPNPPAAGPGPAA